MALTPRGKALRHFSKHRGIKEIPPGSNTDNRPNSTDGRWGIRKAQLACANGGTWLVGTPWCGEWARWALQQAKVRGLTYRLASVSLIEDDARAHRMPFFGWSNPSDWRRVVRGDLVVLFGRGVHVETVRRFKRARGHVYVITEGGNTSSGASGSQSNGGGAYRRVRALSDVHGFARVDYPGGRLRTGLDRLLSRPLRYKGEPSTLVSGEVPSSDAALQQATVELANAGLTEPVWAYRPLDAPPLNADVEVPSSDAALFDKLKGVDDPNAKNLADEIDVARS